MKKILIFTVFFWGIAVLFSQSIITVKSGEGLSGLPQASVFCNKKLLGKTDNNGSLTIAEKCKTVTIKLDGYEDEVIALKPTTEVVLQKEDPNQNNIDAIVIEDKSDPRALAILSKVNDNFKKNSPKSLESYSFKSYEKISFDFDEDSINIYQKYLTRRLDSLSLLPKTSHQKPKAIKDSTDEVSMMKVMTESKLFLWERANEFLYSQQKGEKINVLDNRISGLKEPIYQLLTLRSNRNKIPREILPENRNLYRFFLTDSIEIDGRSNYVIRFRETSKQGTNRRKFNGYLYVDQQTFAIKKIESNSNKKNDGSIVSIWEPINDKWFLKKENLKMRAGNMSFKNEEVKKDEKKEDRKKKTTFGNYVFMKVDYFDFKTPIDVDSKQFNGYTMSVKNTDGKFLDQYRTDSLSSREKMTYEKIDSVGKKFKLDQKASVISSLLRGKLRYKMIDFDVFKTRISKYEGLRVGLGVKLNEHFNPYISPDAYVGYGFRNKEINYGFGIDFNTSLDRNSFFRVEYFNDVATSGGFSQEQWNFKMKIMNSGADLKNNKFFHFEGFRLGYEVDITNGLTLQFSGKKQNEEARFDYFYRNENRIFKNFATNFTMKFSPNSNNIMTPTGKFTYDQNFPEVYFNYEQGYKSLGGEFNYSRLDVLYTHQFRTKLGVTGTRVYGGLMTGDAPIWHHFQMAGLDSVEDKNFFSHFNLTTYLGFATMEAGRYFNDKFMGYYFTHRLPWYFKSFGRNTSSFDFVYKGTIGNMKNTEVHQFQFEKLDRLYQEVGLEYNNFLSTNFNLGIFYRVGYYATPSFVDNFAIQLKVKLLGF